MLRVTPVQGAKSSAPTTIIQETYERPRGDVSELALSLVRAFGVSVFA
jgi:hypothetical protein